MSLRKVGPDFHLVELTEHGTDLAGGNPIRVSNGRIALRAVPGEQHKVARYEWDLLLRDHVTPAGKPMFAIAPEKDQPEAPAEEPTEVVSDEEEPAEAGADQTEENE